jgi:glutamine cyclotransferase
MVHRLLIAVAVLAVACGPRYLVDDRWEGLDSQHLRIPWRQVRAIGHATDSFTQGLVFVGPRLYESVGLVGQSRLLELDPATGATLRTVHWPPSVGRDHSPFAEGLAYAGGRLIQLSWQSQIALTWSEDFTRGPNLPYRGEGWGLCFDGTNLWRSDGSSALIRHRVADFAEESRVTVRVDHEPVTDLNELECFEGSIYANVWHTPYVVRIDPATGQVTGVLDLSPLVTAADAQGWDAVLNGIAWDPTHRHLYVTGKLWPHIYVLTVDGR